MLKKVKGFDWILIGICILAIVFFGIIFFRKSTYITVTINIGEDSFYYNKWLSGTPNWTDTQGTKNWYANLFYKGQKERDGLGKIQAEVLDIYSYDKSQNRKSLFIRTRLNVVYSRSSGTYTFKGVPVLIGSKIKINFDDIFTEGLITDVDGNFGEKAREKITVEAQIIDQNQTYLESSGTNEYLADSIKKNEMIKDNNGNSLIKILDVIVLPAKKTVATSNGQLILANDPTRKDIKFKLEINALKIDNKYYLFEDVPILVDQVVPINTSTVSVFPVVTKFLENEDSPNK